MAIFHRISTMALVMGLTVAATAWAQSAAAPVPRPFPGSPSGAPGAATTAPATRGNDAPAAVPAQQPAAPVIPAPAASPTSGAPVLPTTVPVYPSAEFIDAYDAGAGQRYYLYGATQPYADIVAFYRTALKTGGREIYKMPGVQQFDLGKFQEDTMAFPPSIVVKDYVTENSPGYLAVKGTVEKRYRTIIQIVPPGPGK